MNGERNPLRYIAERTGLSVDDILDMSVEEMLQRTLEVRADAAWLEARIALLESLCDDINT